ncbi:Nitrogen regulation protein NR(I) [Roseimaritima multifibrata]|uniref:DNA-binding transcriptional regulator NtrC n=1 Tax=Roseimaritima multifibrata TaxID=1930274 RepID=A0A517MPI8_9BACT|nr:sigma-54 dependent transcriptional regulator [Roseimaritima multifibrata]QDS96697.1 Nitrogen regulation protein NR(I) [Roseimaritima multifibrata]
MTESDPANVLVVDDESSICWALERLLSEEGHHVQTAGSAERGLEIAAEQPIDLVILDVRLPKQDGIAALPEFVRVTSGAPIVVMTAFGDLKTAVAAMQNGASDYLIKPFSLENVTQTCRKALMAARAHQRANQEPEAAPSSKSDAPAAVNQLVGTSPAMQQVFRQIALVADSDLSVLITGETGTGKELVAAAIHQHSRRRDSTYLPVAPVAMNPDLIESELFGHVKGAFTGAAADRAGLFERAAGGTVLLDEIGDLPLGTQVKLLRVLEQGEYCRVGDVEPKQADVRILAATHCDLSAAVRNGTFREDLFYRLAGAQLHLTPLRNRPEDIGPLCESFLKQWNYPAAADAIQPELLSALAARPWHGNVRELKNALQHASVVARGRPLVISDFPQPTPGKSESASSTDVVSRLQADVARWMKQQIDSNPESASDLHESFLRVTEPILLEMALEQTSGNRVKAAELLGIHRGTLRDRLRTYGISEGSEKERLPKK